VHTLSCICSFSLLDDLLGTSDQTSSTGGNKTDLLSSGFVTADSRGMTDMLMVTTTVRMLDRVHGDTSDSGPMVSLRLLSVPAVDSLQHRFVASLTSSTDADHGSARSLDGFSLARRQLDSSDLTLIGVTNDNGRGTRSPGETSPVTHLGFTVGDDSSFGHQVDWKDVANREGSLGTAVNELSGIHSFDGNEVLISRFVAISIAESNLGKRCTSAWVMNNVLNHSLDVTLSFRIVESPESGGSDLVSLVRSKNETTTVSLSSDASTHSNRFTS